MVSNTGGMGILAADAADAAGWMVPRLADRLRHHLGQLVAITTGTSNPIDLGAGATAETLSGVLEVVLESDEVDIVLVVHVPTTLAKAQPLVDALTRVRPRHPDTPMISSGSVGLGRNTSDVTVYHAIDHAIASDGHALQ